MGSNDEKEKIAKIIANEIVTLMGGMFGVAETMAADSKIPAKLGKPISKDVIKDKIWLQFHLKLPDFIAVQIIDKLGSIPTQNTEDGIATQISSAADGIARQVNTKKEAISKLITGAIGAGDVTNITTQIGSQQLQVKQAIATRIGTATDQPTKEKEIKKRAETIAKDIYEQIKTKVKEDGIPEDRMVDVLKDILIAQAGAIAEKLVGVEDSTGQQTANIIKGEIESTYKKHIQGDIPVT